MSEEKKERLEELRTALAINRGIRLLEDIREKAKTTVEHHEATRVDYFRDLYTEIHEKLFTDCKWQSKSAKEGTYHRPGAIPSWDKSKALREVMQDFVERNGAATKEAPGLFDPNGFAVQREPKQLAAELARLYQHLKEAEIFDYGNELTRDFFVVALGALPAIKSTFSHGIDFRRMDAEDLRALHDKSSTKEQLETAFLHAIDGTRNHDLPNRDDGYLRWPKSSVNISSIPFLSHRLEPTKENGLAEAVDCLVTVNGGLVPKAAVEKELKAHIESDELLADFPPIRNNQLIGYLPGTEHLRREGKTEVDGIPCTGEAAQLFCLDTNILTGLRGPSHKSLMKLLAEQSKIDRRPKGQEYTLFDLNENPVHHRDEQALHLRENLHRLASGDSRLERAIDVAYGHINIITKKLDAELHEIFHRYDGMQRPVHGKPKLYMSLGGAGAGKTAVQDMMRAECGDDFVVASLDEFRKASELFTVLRAANHHADDYKVIEPLANTLRTWVADRARAEGVNLLYDGTGIDFNPRYANIIKKFKNNRDEHGEKRNASGQPRADYDVVVCGVDTALSSIPGREKEFRFPAMRRVESRYKGEENRALPWVVVVGKHIKAASSLLDAIETPEAGKVVMFANDGGRGEHYPMLETFTVSEEELRRIQALQHNGGLAEHFRKMLRTRTDSALRTLATPHGEQEPNPAKLEGMIRKIPSMNDSNVAYLAHRSGDKYRLTAIYNTTRAIDLLEKGMLNPQAASEDLLTHKPEGLSFHVPKPDRIDPERPWVLMQQQPSSSYTQAVQDVRGKPHGAREV